MCNSLYFTGCVALLTRQVTCQGFSECYSDINCCFWTDGSLATQLEAQTACQQRNNSFLPRVTDGSVRRWLSAFRTAADILLGSSGFWIGVKSVSISSFHWIDGSPVAGLLFSVLESPPYVHTHPFNGPLSGTTRVSRYQKCKTNLDFTEARDSEWQWHPLDHMQVCTSHIKARICPADVNKKTNWNA